MSTSNIWFRRTLDLIEAFDAPGEVMFQNVNFLDKGEGRIVAAINGIDHQGVKLADGFYIDLKGVNIDAHCGSIMPGYRKSLGNHGMIRVYFKRGAESSINESKEIFQNNAVLNDLVKRVIENSGFQVPSDLRPMEPPSGMPVMIAQGSPNTMQLNWYSRTLAESVARYSGLCGI